MKNNSIIVTLLFLFATNVNGQKFDNNRQFRKPKMCATTIVGLSSLGVGIGLIIGGIGYELQSGAEYQNGSFSASDADHNTATVMAISGAVIGIAGLGLTIGGAIHDISNRHRRWGVITPRKNAIGIVYNF